MLIVFGYLFVNDFVVIHSSATTANINNIHSSLFVSINIFKIEKLTHRGIVITGEEILCSELLF